MTNIKEQIEALHILMNSWYSFPKKFCLMKIFGWSEEDAYYFLKEYKKEQKKREKESRKTLLDKVAEVSTNCCGSDCCSKD